MDQRHRNSFVVTRRGEAPAPVSAAVTDLPQSCIMPSVPPILRESLPPRIIEAVETAYTCLGGRMAGHLEEIRLRADRSMSITVGGGNRRVDQTLTSAELFSILTRMCGGSLYAYSQNINEGFVTLEGGVRVGIAGEASCEDGHVVGVREITALCIRIPHAHENIGQEMADLLKHMKQASGTPQGLLIYAPPGVGKTTLLRGVTAHLSGGQDPLRTVVVDTRGELTFPLGGERLCLDILTGYPRALGVSIATRCLNAQVIVCDEIGDGREAAALISAYHGGVPLIATAHGGSVKELLCRTGLRLLHKAGLFGAYVGLHRDGSGGFRYDIIKKEAVSDDW